jgi:hypothetical protein
MSLHGSRLVFSLLSIVMRDLLPLMIFLLMNSVG